MEQEEQDGVGESEETFSFEDFDHVKEIASFPLELREKYGTTIEASCFGTEKLVHILQLENKIRFSMFKSTIKINNQNFVLDHETEQFLTCESPFGIAFQTFAGKKALNEYVKNQKEFIEPKEVSLGFDPMTQKQDTIQYVPILSTLKAILSHEEVLTYVQEQNVFNNFNFKIFKDCAAYRTNPFLNANPNILEICMYHDDFGIVNPLGNKIHTHKISAFYFMLGNLLF